MCLRVQEYVLSDEAPVHTLDDVQELAVHGVYVYHVCILHVLLVMNRNLRQFSE